MESRALEKKAGERARALQTSTTTRLGPDYKSFNRTTRVPGLNIVHKPQQEDSLTKKVAEGHF